MHHRGRPSPKPFPPRASRGLILRTAVRLALLFGVARAIPAGATPHALPPDPAIANLVAQVSADSLLASVQTLQGFFNRNTASDTTSAVQGIGAARNWVHRRFAGIGDLPGGRVQPSFFDFEDVICGTDRAHRNVLGTIAGALHPSRIFLVGGHLDSRNNDGCDVTSFAPGANDDGSAIAALLEEARLLQTLAPDATVVFQAFTGEEQGLFGSEHFRDYVLRNGLDVEGMLNLDTIGNVNGCPDSPNCGGGPPTDADSTSVRCFSGDPATGSSRQLARLAKLIGEAYVPGMTVRLIPLLDRQGRGGDHVPFYEAGVPAVRFIETLEYTLQQHNSQDITGNMEFSYLRRNVRVNLAVLADLAMAPPTPGGLQVFDHGTGGSIRATWSPVSGIPDLAGYRVAWRYADQQDTLYYADIVDAGAGTSLDIGGLTDEVPLEVSVSAYDAQGHESSFCPERPVTPGVIPHLPAGFTVESRADRIELHWSPPQELDIARFRLYRSLYPNQGFAVIDSLGPDQVGFTDRDVRRETNYYYRLSKVDLDGHESPLTPADMGRLVVHNYGILLVDATLNGPGGLGTPTDGEVDSYYETLLSGYPIGARWDWVENYDHNGVLLTDADMGRYRTVLIHSDVRQSSIKADTTEIRQYLANGGQVWLSGWNLKESLGGSAGEYGVFRPGSFVHDIVHADSIRTAQATDADFHGAAPISPGYPPLTVNPAKWPFQGGNLSFMDALVGDPLDPPEAVSLYTYVSVNGPSGPNDGRVDALRHPSALPRFFFTDFPLYFMDTAGAAALVDKVLAELGYGPTAVGDRLAWQRGPALRIEPCPFAGTTRIALSAAPGAPATLEIYDAQGRLVRALLRGRIPANGAATLDWDGRGDQGRPLASGVYFAVLSAGGERISRPVILIR